MRGLALAAAAGVASGQTPPDEPPPVGQPCVVSGGKCMCGSTDLSEFRGREIRTPADSDGYRYMFRMCEDITTAQLPEGCQPASGIPPLPHPAVVKWKDDTPMDCTMLGSFGPCPGVTCGMTYQPAANGVAVTWQYEYGCYNTFRVFLTEGHQAAPQAAPFNDPVDAFPCYWTLHWASLVSGRSNAQTTTTSEAEDKAALLEAKAAADVSHCNRIGLSTQSDLCPLDSWPPAADDVSTPPCQNGGECQDEGNSYTCVCANGFSGRNCDQASDPDPAPGAGAGSCPAGTYNWRDGNPPCRFVYNRLLAHSAREPSLSE